MLTEEEEAGEREYWEREDYKARTGKDWFRTEVRKINGIEVEYHFSGNHLMGKYERKTGKMVR